MSKNILHILIIGHSARAEAFISLWKKKSRVL
jgi:hypothetical protein